MVWPKEYAPTHLSLEEVAVRDCQKVLTGSLRQYFVDFWCSTVNFRPPAQASPNSLVNFTIITIFYRV